MEKFYEYNNKGKFLREYNSKEAYIFEKATKIPVEENEFYCIDAENNVAFGRRVGRDLAVKTVNYHHYVKSLKKRHRENEMLRPMKLPRGKPLVPARIYWRRLARLLWPKLMMSKSR